MIIRLKGKVEKLLPTSVELCVQGITYLVEIPLLASIELQNTLENATEISLEIAQIIREDSNLLYGFTSKEAREIFLRLLKVNGVGAKIALAILSTFSPAQFLSIAQTSNLGALKGVKGVGAKVASKILLEFSGFSQSVESSGNNARLAYDALVALGFRESEISTLLSKLDSATLAKEPNEIVKCVLKSMGK